MAGRTYAIGAVSHLTTWTDGASGERIVACVGGSGKRVNIINDSDGRVVAFADAKTGAYYFYGLAYSADTGYLYVTYYGSGSNAQPVKKINLSGVDLQAASPVDITPGSYAYTAAGWTPYNNNLYGNMVAWTTGGKVWLATVGDDALELYNVTDNVARYTTLYMGKITHSVGVRDVCAVVDGVLYWTAENFVLYITSAPAGNNFWPLGIAGTLADDFSVDSRITGWETWGTRSSPWSPDAALGSTTVTGGQMRLSVTDPTTDSTYYYRFAIRRMTVATPIAFEIELYCPAWVSNQMNAADLYFGATQKRLYLQFYQTAFRCSFDGAEPTAVTAGVTTLRWKITYSDPTLTIQYKADGAANWSTLQTYNSAGLAGIYYLSVDVHGRYAGTYNLFINEVIDGYASGALSGPPILQPAGNNALAVLADGDTPRLAFGTAAGCWQVTGDKSAPGVTEQDGVYHGVIAAARVVQAVAYNAAGDRIALGCADGAYISTLNGVQIADLTDALPNPSVNAIVFDGEVLLVGTGDGLYSTADYLYASGGPRTNTNINAALRGPID